MAKFLMTLYKSKVLKSKLNEDPLQRRIYFINLMESLEMIFSQYKETSEALQDYPTIGGGYIKDYFRKAIRNILHENIDVLSRRLISEFPIDGVKFISKLQSHCANTTFDEKISHDRLFQKVTHKRGNQK